MASNQPLAEDEDPGTDDVAQVRTTRTPARRQPLEEDAVPGSAPAAVPAPSSPPTHEDWTRRVIAWVLLAVISLLACAGAGALITAGSFKSEDLQQLGVFISPIIALASAAFGFYFGAGEKHDKDKQ
ncbi:hypothetical protein [Streptomyces sp. Caat 7-52]|uniref:hypothetical protein n=1 Tax=Streptomyces sp. Caat 7-52 TaxID=2949637 RepID=UPI002035786D|nr:hypothetical protein [Streptomyces sp. Caat 7-52]